MLSLDNLERHFQIHVCFRKARGKRSKALVKFRDIQIQAWPRQAPVASAVRIFKQNVFTGFTGNKRFIPPSCQNLCRIAESVPCWKGTLDFSYQTEKNSEWLKVRLEPIESESICELFKGLDVIRCWVRSRSVQHKWLGYLWVPGVSMSGGGCMACMRPQHLMWHWPSLRFATLFCKKQTNEE